MILEFDSKEAFINANCRNRIQPLKKETTVIANLTSIDGVSISADTIESTNLSTEGGYRTFVNGLKDAGEVSISGHFGYDDHNDIVS